MTENKALFVSLFADLIKHNTNEYSDIDNIVYVKNTTDSGVTLDEHIYVIYKNNAQKKINVSCDSCSGIMEDFITHINKAPYLREHEKIVQ